MSYTEWLEDRLIKHGGTGVCFETFSIDREWCRTHCTLGKMLPDKACLMRAYETEKQAETTSVIKGQISIFEGGDTNGEA